MSADFEPRNIKSEVPSYTSIYQEAIVNYTSNMMPTGLGTGYGSNAIMTHGSNDSSAPSSTSSSHTRLAGANCDDSGMSTLSNSGCMLTPNLTQPGGMMNYGSPDYQNRVGDDFELEGQFRSRSNTWPLKRPDNSEFNSQTSPMIHDRIPEEDGYENPEDGSHPSSRHASNVMLNCTIDNQGGAYANELNSPNQLGSPDEYLGAGTPPASAKKSTTRRNAWGNMSYADLITQAILSSPEKRLTLSQVYEWMVQNVPYFRDKGDSNSSAGWKNSIRHNLSLHSRFMRIQNEGAGKSSWWVINPDAKTGRGPRRARGGVEARGRVNSDIGDYKNSIRHNLSLHSRFMRIQNEGAGKSSWWVINPDAKPGRNPRRRANTIDNTTKVAMDKVRKRGIKSKMALGRPIQSGQSSMLGSQASINDTYPEDDFSPFNTFRERVQSNVSNFGERPSTSRMSPGLADEFADDFNQFDFPPYDFPKQTIGSDILASETAGIERFTLSDGQQIKQEFMGMKPPPQAQMPQMVIPKMEPMDPKPESSVQPPPAYTELQPPRIGSQGQLIGKLMGAGAPSQFNHYPYGINNPAHQQATMMSPQGWQPPRHGLPIQQATHAVTYTLIGGAPTINGQVPVVGQPNTSLPMDLENVMPEHSIMDLDMEAVLRHEASLTRDNQLHFDL